MCIRCIIFACFNIVNIYHQSQNTISIVYASYIRSVCCFFFIHFCVSYINEVLQSKFTIIISHSIEEQQNKKSHTLHPVCNLTETKTSTIQRNSFTKAIIKQTKTLLNKTDGNFLSFC